MSSFPEYGTLFKDTTSRDAGAVGKEYVIDAIKVLENRWASGASLRILPIENIVCQKLNQKSQEFLQDHAKTLFETDNLKHVSRLVQNIDRYSKDLINFLGVHPDHVKLIAALHDLGKSLVPPQMGKFMGTVFPGDDFINTRVLPHELYSMYWIHEFAKEMKIHSGLAALLMDQISNHNFGPDLRDPINAFLLEKRSDGTYKHWWLEHWKQWAQKMNFQGLKINELYGSTLSPIATSLVLFDRIDGGHPHSWEKFLHQGSLAGQITFSIHFVLDVLTNAHECAIEQILAVGRQIHGLFVEAKKNTPMMDFLPINEAMEMLEKSKRFILRLQESNRLDRTTFFKTDPKKSVLYQDQKSGWFRIDSDPNSRKAVKCRWDSGKWQEIEISERPIDLLLATIYNDWEEG